MQTNEKTDDPETRLLQRRIRRYVHAPMHRFAAVVPPDLSNVCDEEFQALDILARNITEIGVEFSGKIRTCYLANLQLRTASRILCLFPAFRAGAVEELFKKVSQIQWELWLNGCIPLRVKAYVERSRIQHEGLVLDTVIEGIQKRFQVAGLDAPPRWGDQSTVEEDNDLNPPSLEQRVFLHLRRNRSEISLDTTGAHLHMRGYRLKPGCAPLRETLAAAILIRSGWRGEVPLVDGMCGSGTLPIEAALIARRLPPGLNRSFLFEKWPSFAEKTWAFLLRKAREDSLVRPPFPIVAIDHAGETINMACENAGRAGVADDIQWLCEDFFNFRPRKRNLSPGLVFLNPPYGKRLAGGDEALYESLGAHLRQHFSGWRIVVLAPERSLAMHLHIKSIRFWNIVHGGIPIVAATARL